MNYFRFSVSFALLLRFHACFNLRSIITKWRTLHLLPEKEAGGVVRDVILLQGFFSPVQREVQLYSTVERVLARMAACGRVEIIENFLRNLHESVDWKKVNRSLWSQLPNSSISQFLDGLTALLGWTEDVSLLFPLNLDFLVVKLSTEKLALLCGVLIENFPGKCDDLLLKAVKFGHLLPSRHLEMMSQSELFSKLEGSEQIMQVAKTLKGHFSAEALVYDMTIDYWLTLPALFARFREENEEEWSEVFVSAMYAVIPSSTALHATFRAFCRLNGGSVDVAQSFLNFGAYPLCVDGPTGTFPIFNAVLAGNEDLALFLFAKMPIPLKMLEQVDNQTGVNILQAALHYGMVDLLRKFVAIEDFSGVELKAWHYKQAQQAILCEIPFTLGVFDYDYWPEQYSLSLAAYSSGELIERHVAFLSTSLLYGQGFWLLQYLGVEEVWVLLPDSGVLAVMAKDYLNYSVTVDELYSPRDISLRYLKFQ